MIKEGASTATLSITFDPAQINMDEFEERAKVEGEYFAANIPSFQFKETKTGSGYDIEILMGSIYNPTVFQEKKLDVVVDGIVKECQGMSAYEKINSLYTVDRSNEYVSPYENTGEVRRDNWDRH